MHRSSLGYQLPAIFLRRINCSVAVPGGQKCDIDVIFRPTVTGTRTGTLTVSFGGRIHRRPFRWSAMREHRRSVSRRRPLPLAISQLATTSGAQQVNVTNNGSGPLLLSSVQTTSQSQPPNNFGAPVAPSGSCTIQVTFTPSASGAQTGTLTIADNAPDSPQVVTLTGNAASQGIAPRRGLWRFVISHSRRRCDGYVCVLDRRRGSQRVLGR